MIFSKHSILLVVLAALLSACAQMPIGGKTEKQVESPQLETDTSTDTEQSTTETFVAIPKPEAPLVSIPSQARDEFSLAKQDMLRKKWSDAEAKLLFMTETYPQLAGVYTNLGIVYEKRDKPEKAEQAYRFSLKKNPLNFDASNNLGILLRDQGKFEEAEQVYLAALKQWPHHQATLLNLGILYDLYMGELHKALAQYTLAQKLNAKEDRKLKGWIIDLERRLPTETDQDKNEGG